MNLRLECAFYRLMECFLVVHFLFQINRMHAENVYENPERKGCTEAGFLVRVHPEQCLILSRAQIRALLYSSKSKFIPA
jgi:hypothetical protein